MAILFSTIPGFLHHIFPTRASLMLDVVCVAMILVIPAMSFGVSLAKRKKYQLHKYVQCTLAAVLLFTVVLFEIDIQVMSPWRDLAQASPYYDSGVVRTSLAVHLCFSVPTFLLWAVVIARALKNFPNPPAPNHHSRWHRKYGNLAVWGMTGTAITGWVFYYLAFVA
jgi:putative membrane protein